MVVQTTLQVVQQVEHDESLFKNEKDRTQMQRKPLTTKVCSKIHVCIRYLLSLSMSEHRLQADELDREFF